MKTLLLFTRITHLQRTRLSARTRIPDVRAKQSFVDFEFGELPPDEVVSRLRALADMIESNVKALSTEKPSEQFSLEPPTT
jgi:hypothetical protein